MGYVMDQKCIDLEKLLDNPSVITLQNPEQHSYHCLLDVGSCYNSGFTILAAPDQVGENHTVAFKFDSAANQMALMKGRAEGYQSSCSTCTGTDSSKTRGFHVAILGTIEDETSDPPVISVQVMQSVPADGGDVCENAVDACPDDPDKFFTEGQCGCDMPETENCMEEEDCPMGLLSFACK